MKEKETKVISPDDNLRLFALWTMAKQHVAEAERFEHGMAKILGVEHSDLGWLTDAIYGHYPEVTFDEALKRQGFVVEDKAP